MARVAGQNFEKTVERVLRNKFPIVLRQVKLGYGVIDLILPSYCFVEVKLTHSYDGYEQLTRYRRNAEVAGLHPLARERMVEICKFFNPDIAWPRPFKVLDDLSCLRDLEAGLYVYPWSRFDR